jgi:hypothetical protein
MRARHDGGERGELSDWLSINEIKNNERIPRALSGIIDNIVELAKELGLRGTPLFCSIIIIITQRESCRETPR